MAEPRPILRIILVKITPAVVMEVCGSGILIEPIEVRPEVMCPGTPLTTVKAAVRRIWSARVVRACFIALLRIKTDWGLNDCRMPS